MEREIGAMNHGLIDHPFHNERYSFHHARLVEFQPILKIVEISRTSPEALDMLFKGDEVPPEFPHLDTLREIEALLEDPEKDFSVFEDYRNFFTFEIHMQDVVTGRRQDGRRAAGQDLARSSRSQSMLLSERRSLQCMAAEGPGAVGP